MRDGFAVFDTHLHIGTAAHSGRRQPAGDILRQMDGRGVDRALAIPFPVVEDERAAHDEIGAAVKAHPDRFVGAACLHPRQPVAQFRAELRRCREEYGFVALKMQPQFHGLNPSPECADFVYEEAVALRMAIIAHTGSGIPFALPSAFMDAARSHPSLPFVLAHSGGSGLFAAEAVTAADFCPNIYLELSTLMPNHVLAVLARVPSARLMIGSDLPENLDVEIAKILWLDVPAEDKRNILSGTASRLFS